MDAVKTFPKSAAYLNSLNIENADPLDKLAKNLIYNDNDYEKASQALRRRFSRGAQSVEAIDRGGRSTQITRESDGGNFIYKIRGSDGSWTQPDERIWVVAMYALWQMSKKHQI